ncbi:MAG: hypothetical protein B7733_20470 [Myxococcales bacterium FL481]|nr:MAG: hypothetical protein B7733_20470 [Myxococcales bacterium FL481]
MTSSAPPSPKPQQPDPPKSGDKAPSRRSLVGSLLGWLVLPGLLATALVALGVHVGANHTDMWFVRLVAWVVGQLQS